jgi:Flp pilus assembly protein TadD
VPAYINRGIAYSLSGNHGRGLVDLNRAIELDAENVNAYLERGRIYHRMGQDDRARADIQKAIDLDPSLASESQL